MTMYSYRSSSKDEDGADSSQWNEKLSPLKKQKIGFQSEEKNSLSQEKVSISVKDAASTAHALPGLAAYSSSDSSDAEG